MASGLGSKAKRREVVPMGTGRRKRGENGTLAVPGQRLTGGGKGLGIKGDVKDIIGGKEQ